MAVTPVYNLFSPDGGNLQDIPVSTAAMQDSVEDALISISAGISFQVGSNADRLALTGAHLYEGLTFWTTDTRLEWIYSASSWKIVGGDTTLAVLRRTSAPLTSASGSYSRISTTAAWTATGSGQLRSATFAGNELTVQTPGWYQVFWNLWSTGSTGGIAGISVNAASGATTVGAETLHALAPITFNVSALGSANAMVRLAAGDRLSLWGYGAGAALNIRAAATPEPTNWGARWVSA